MQRTMELIEAREARLYLQKRDLLRHVYDLHELSEEFPYPVTIYANYIKDADELGCMMTVHHRDEYLEVRFFADTVDDFRACLHAVPTVVPAVDKGKPLVFVVDAAWMVDPVAEEFGCELVGRSLFYAYTKKRIGVPSSSVRMLGADDLPVIQQFIAKYTPRMPGNHPARLDNVIKSGDSRLFGWIEDGALIAYVVVTRVDIGPESRDQIWDITHIWTEPSHHGSGLAEETLAVSTAWILGHGGYPYYSGVAVGNRESQKACENIGFELVGEKWMLAKL